MNTDEFREVGHCGGQVIFHVNTHEGRRSYQVTVRHSRPSPFVVIGIYALPQGIPVGPMDIAGLGGSSNEPPVKGCFPVYMASDSQGMFGRECPACSGYWRAGPGTGVCPYCAHHDQAHQFVTRAQATYVRQYCALLAGALQGQKDGDYTIDMDAVADAVGKTSEKPPFYYAEESQQTKFECHACGEINDILGKYGYCSMCGTRNDLQQLRKSMQHLRDRVNLGGPYEGCAKDAVAAFDSYAAQYVKQLLKAVPLTLARRSLLDRSFHNLNKTADLFRTIFDIDLLDGVTAEDAAFAARMFHRRHVYEHNGGEADEEYIRESGDTEVRPKQALRESQDTVHRLIGLVLKIAANLHHGFHLLIPPLAEPVRWHDERKRRMAER